MQRVNVIGDSHTRVFGHIPYCRAQNLGAYLAYNLIEHDDVYMKTIATVPKKEILVCCWGEIDVRVYLKEHLNIEECVKRYVDALIEFRNLDYRVVVFGTVGSSWDPVETASSFPAVGTCKERNEIAIAFNKELQKQCEAKGFKFFTILDKLIDANGETIREYYQEDAVHLSEKAVLLIDPLLVKIVEEMEK